jgi:hypothetical protein
VILGPGTQESTGLISTGYFKELQRKENAELKLYIRDYYPSPDQSINDD